MPDSQLGNRLGTIESRIEWILRQLQNLLTRVPIVEQGSSGYSPYSQQQSSSGATVTVTIDANISAASGGTPGQGTGTLCVWNGTVDTPTTSPVVTLALCWPFADKGVKAGAYCVCAPKYGPGVFWNIVTVDSCANLF